jgi:hypothetical protein
MASEGSQWNALDEENDRLIRERKELEGDNQVCFVDIYQISVGYLSTKNFN